MDASVCVNGAEAWRIARRFPSYRDFVDAALFDPTWGYYSTGAVRFGDGGHYDTFPLALAPLFGEMLARYSHRFWRRAGQPADFEVCELGAGNGQLALDTIIAVRERACRDRGWRRFAESLRYRIVERSPGLIARQRAHLGPLARQVTWTRADLAQRPARSGRVHLPFATHGVVFANEVLDCLAHHKVVPRPDGMPGVVFVVPELSRRRSSIPLERGVGGCDRAIPRTQLRRVLADPELRRAVVFHEVVLPVAIVPPLHLFLWEHYPEFFAPGARFKPYFACPAFASLIANTARLYRHSVGLWIDYGAECSFHLDAPESQRVFAGPPHSGASIYGDPGRDDITFLVDFSVAAATAQQAGLRVTFYGPQGELGRRSGVRFDRRARELILRYRTLSWMLAVVGVGPERAWRHTGLTWNRRAGKGGRLLDDVRKAIAEFVGRRRSNFKLLIVESPVRPRRRAPRSAD